MAGLTSVAWGVATDRGARPGNEDSYLAAHPIFLVADGMGGHDRGEVASAAAVEAFRDLVDRAHVSPDEVRERLGIAAQRVEAISSDPAHAAGTTLAGVAVVVEDEQAYWLVLNLGDSRVYRLSSGELEQVSVDHSEVQELLESGELTSQSARTYARRHVVTRALGASGLGDPDYWMLPIGSHDRMLVCSDGLTGELSDAQIAATLLAEPDPRRAADLLLHLALQAGARDNVTVLVVDARAGMDGESETIPSASHAIDDTLPRLPEESRG